MKSSVMKSCHVIDIINLYFYLSFFLGGSFESKNYPDNYPNKYDEVIFRIRIKYQQIKLNITIQTWKLESSSEGSIIYLTFESFDVENHRDCKWDYVKVSYGSFNQKFCGNSIPGPFISDTSITVQIHTDHTVIKSGFSAKWTITISSGVT